MLTTSTMEVSSTERETTIPELDATTTNRPNDGCSRGVVAGFVVLAMLVVALGATLFVSICYHCYKWYFKRAKPNSGTDSNQQPVVNNGV